MLILKVVCQVGLLTPQPAATQQLRTGQVGYVITGIKSTRSARLGDTWHLLKQPVDPLPGFKPVKSMVFAGIFPLKVLLLHGCVSICRSGQFFRILHAERDSLPADHLVTEIFQASDPPANIKAVHAFT